MAPDEEKFDAGDDLHRLLQCLWQALEPFDLPWRISPEALALMAASAEPREQQEAADEIVNTLEQAELAHGVIALDDLHHVDQPEALAACCRACPNAGPSAPPRATNPHCGWRACALPGC